MTRSPPTLASRARRVVDPSTRQPTAEPPGTRPRSVRVHREGGRDVVLPLREEERLLIGRHDAADLVFESAGVSRVHGMLRADGGAWLFEDLGSSNGSTLRRAGGAPTLLAPHAPVELSAGDVVDLGGEGDLVELLSAAAEEPVGPRGDPTLASAAGRAFSERIDLAARTRVPVFLLGPSGCGKTYTARQVHLRAGGAGPFVPVNCARLPTDPTTLHSELLGHVRGAFTGAESARVGKLFHANGGTLFLDEVECLPVLAQGFLLDVLEATGDLSPLGSREIGARPPVFRLVSAAKVPLSSSTLRPDLCERLAEGHTWRMPTLEERREDIPGLVRHFTTEQGKLLGVPVEMTEEAVALAVATRWPGQIRQLRAMVVALAQMALATLGDGGTRKILLRRTDLERHLQERDEAFGLSPSPRALADTVVPSAALAAAPGIRVKADARALTREQVLAALRAAGNNQSEAARNLGIARNTLARRMKDFGLESDGD